MKEYNVSDKQLLAQYLEGNEGAFGQLVERYSSKVFTTIYLIVKDRDIANDLMQDTFIKVIHKIKGGNYNEEGKFLPWVQRIAYNMAIDHFRRGKRYPMISADNNEFLYNSKRFAEDPIENKHIEEETQLQVRELIERLPDTQKEVLVMRHFNDMSFQEIAEATGVSINTALGRMRYALINLRKELKLNVDTYDKNLYPR